MKWKGMDEKAASYHNLIAEAIAGQNPSQAKNLMKCHLEDMLFELKKSLRGTDEP